MRPQLSFDELPEAYDSKRLRTSTISMFRALLPVVCRPRNTCGLGSLSALECGVNSLRGSDAEPPPPTRPGRSFVGDG